MLMDSTEKVLGSTVGQKGYKETLLKSIEEIRKQAARIKEEADRCLAWAVHDQGLVIKNMDKKSDTGLHLLENMYRMLDGKYFVSRCTEQTLIDPPQPDCMLSRMRYNSRSHRS